MDEDAAMRVAATENLVEEAIRFRNETSQPDTLKKLAIFSVIENFEKFKRDELIFRYLPKSVVNDVLKKIIAVWSQWDQRRFSLDDAEKQELVLQLLNPSVTNFDCQCSRGSPAIYFDHLLKNCPMMTSVSYVDHYSTKNSRLPFQDIATWKNLKHFDLSGFMCYNEDMKLFQQHMPQLETMGFAISLQSFTMEGVEYLSRMSNLKFLSIFCRSKDPDEGLLLMEIAAHCAGKSQCLEKLRIDENDGMHSGRSIKFVEVYGQCYPHKELQVCRLILTSGLTFARWPTCLSADVLVLDDEQGDLSLEDIGKISPLDCFEKLEYSNLLVSLIYPIIESKLGSAIEELKIFCVDCADVPLDLCRVLAACPNLDTLDVSCSHYQQRQEFRSKICPLYFKNFEYLRLSGVTYIEEGEEAMLEVYKMFLVGCETPGLILRVEDGELEALHQVLKENPTCLTNLDEVHFILNTLDQKFVTEEIIKILICRSPRLRLIKIDQNYYISESFPVSDEFQQIKETVERVGVAVICG